MDNVERRREILTQAIREPHWRAEVHSVDGEILRELADLGWVELDINHAHYTLHVTERGLERHASWGDERRQRSRRNAETDFPAA